MGTTYTQAKNTFVNYLFVKGFTESTMIAYLKDLETWENFTKIILKNKIKYMDNYTKIEIRLYKEYLCSLVKERIFKRVTAIRKYNALKAFYKHLNTTYSIENIVYGDDFGKEKQFWEEQGNDFIPKTLTDQEITQILSVLEKRTDKNKYRDTCIIKLLLATGMRRSEVLLLNWENVNLFTREIKIIREKTTNANSVLISKKLIEDLATLYRLDCSQGRVFKSRQSTTLSNTAFNSIVQKAFRDANLDKKGYTAHTFRHTFVTNCIKANISLEKIAKYTGHTLDTLQEYAHLTSIDTQEIAELYA